MSEDLAAIKDIVDTWNINKVHGREFVHTDMRKFIELMNYASRKLISIVDRRDVEFWTGLFELAMNAQTLVTPGAKVIGDGIDRTNV